MENYNTVMGRLSLFNINAAELPAIFRGPCGAVASTNEGLRLILEPLIEHARPGLPGGAVQTQTKPRFIHNLISFIILKAPAFVPNVPLHTISSVCS